MTMGKKLYVANVGDSRGIVIRSIQEDKSNKDHKEEVDN
jgi:serine/threonine protein phosphatase PrpC